MELNKWIKIRKRIRSIERMFDKYADVCPECLTLHIWQHDESKPETCRKCETTLSYVVEIYTKEKVSFKIVDQ
jgi:hypothetical protein